MYLIVMASCAAVSACAGVASLWDRDYITPAAELSLITLMMGMNWLYWM